jgi:hypothetical protein
MWCDVAVDAGLHTSFINGKITCSENLQYCWLPYTAVLTSNPDPTLPCAMQCATCAQLCSIPSASGLEANGASIGVAVALALAVAVARSVECTT